MHGCLGPSASGEPCQVLCGPTGACIHRHGLGLVRLRGTGTVLPRLLIPRRLPRALAGRLLPRTAPRCCLLPMLAGRLLLVPSALLLKERNVPALLLPLPLLAPLLLALLLVDLLLLLLLLVVLGVAARPPQLQAQRAGAPAAVAPHQAVEVEVVVVVEVVELEGVVLGVHQLQQPQG